MKIIILGSASSSHIIKWVNALAERRIDVYLISMPNHKLCFSDQISKEVKLIYLKYTGLKGYYLNFLYLRNILSKIKPDILNVHYASGYGTLARLAKYNNIILNVWGSDVYIYPKKNFLNRRNLEKNLQSSTKIISTSHCMAKEITKYTKKSCSIVPFGVDTKKFIPIINGIVEKEIRIGMVKSLEEVYGIEYLIKALKILECREKKSHNYRLDIYGKGSLEKKLKNMITELNLKTKVNFHGYIKNELLPEVLNEFDIFVMPSLSESFGVSVLEAQSCEVAVIVSDAEGLKEIIKDKETGIIVSKKNARELADAIEDLSLDIDFRKKLGRNGRKNVILDYEWNDCVSKMIEIYKKTLEENKEE